MKKLIIAAVAAGLLVAQLATPSSKIEARHLDGLPSITLNACDLTQGKVGGDC